MKEPYRTMFEGSEEHWFFSRYVDPDRNEPDWYGIQADDQLDSLSRGEKILLDFAAAFANLALLDESNQYRVSLALRRLMGA